VGRIVGPARGDRGASNLIKKRIVTDSIGGRRGRFEGRVGGFHAKIAKEAKMIISKEMGGEVGEDPQGQVR